MSDVSPTSRVLPGFRPIRAVLDANVFTDRAWLDRLLRDASAGIVSLYWSPKVVEEVSRVRLWIWLKQQLRTVPPPRGSSAWRTLWREYSEDAHTWFARVSPRLRVIEDQPPHEIAWIEPHPDPNDAWLWNAARRSRADVVLTVNLRDGPPVGSDGLSHHDGTTFMHPGAFIVLLDVWNRVQATGTIPDDLETEIRDTVSPASSAHVPAVVAQVRVLLARMAEEAGPAPIGADPAP